MSALGADPDSDSKYARTKADGEAAVRGSYPDAAIVRPSVIFGPGDGLFERFASMAQLSPVLPLVGGGHTRFQPAFVGDVGRALARIVTDLDAAGQTFELGGPGVYEFRELMEMLLAETGQRRLLLTIPFPVAAALGSLGDLLSFAAPPPITADQVRLLKSDNVVSGGFPGFAELGITPATLEAVLPTYLYKYRKGGQYADQEARALARL
jgi:NADH dehydrogenase